MVKWKIVPPPGFGSVQMRPDGSLEGLEGVEQNQDAGAVVVRVEDPDVDRETPIPESPAHAKTELPPPGAAVMNPVITGMTKLSDPAFADDPTSPALDIRKELAGLHAERMARDLGDDATLPALDLSKEIAAIKRIKDPPEDP